MERNGKVPSPDILKHVQLFTLRVGSRSHKVYGDGEGITVEDNSCVFFNPNADSLHVVAVSPGMRAVKPRSYSIIRWLPTVLAINENAIGRVRPSVLPCVFTLTFEITDL